MVVWGVLFHIFHMKTDSPEVDSCSSSISSRHSCPAVTVGAFSLEEYRIVGVSGRDFRISSCLWLVTFNAPAMNVVLRLVCLCASGHTTGIVMDTLVCGLLTEAPRNPRAF